jgi:putative sigma-54 modulation protein
MNDKVIISGLHMNLTDALKAIVLDKSARLFKHEDSIIRVRFELELINCSTTHQNQYVAKGHVEMHGPPIVIAESSNDLYKSIDRLVDKLDRGLRRRSRLQRVKRKQVSLYDTIAVGQPTIV